MMLYMRLMNLVITTPVPEIIITPAEEPEQKLPEHEKPTVEQTNPNMLLNVIFEHKPESEIFTQHKVE